MSASQIYSFMLKMYGAQEAMRIVKQNQDVKDQIRVILIKEIRRTYKNSEAAFQQLDFDGKGYVEVNDFVNSKLIYKLPISKEELQRFLEVDSIFKKIPKLKVEMFSKFFFPSQQHQEDSRDDKSSISQFDGLQITSFNKRAASIDHNLIKPSPVDSQLQSLSKKNIMLTNKMKEAEEVIKDRLKSNWISVRKAFLDLDDDQDGFLVPEDFSKLIGGSSGQQKFDFNVIKMLIKFKTKSGKAKLNYHDFSVWLGEYIEPTAVFYFRHDSQKNPNYEKSMQKTIHQFAGSQRKIREFISNNNLKQNFIQKIQQNYKNLLKAFQDINKKKAQHGGEGYILFDEFCDLVREQGGFEASVENIREFFDWIDRDGDNKISFEDMRLSIGNEISPIVSSIPFRQDIKRGKAITCKYERCFENNTFNATSQYCKLHQNILKDQAVTMFYKLTRSLSEEKWQHFTQILEQKRLVMTIAELSQLFEQFRGKELSDQEKEGVWESFKLKQFMEDNPDTINERLVSLTALVNSRKSKEKQKLKDLLIQARKEENDQEELKERGLHFIGINFVKEMAFEKKKHWGEVWKHVKMHDNERKGIIKGEQLEEILREQFPYELDGKSLSKFFQQYALNKEYVNYIKLKCDVNEQILEKDKEEEFKRTMLREDTLKQFSKTSMKFFGKTMVPTVNACLDKSQLIERKNEQLLEQSDINRAITPNRLFTNEIDKVNQLRNISQEKGLMIKKRSKGNLLPLNLNSARNIMELPKKNIAPFIQSSFDIQRPQEDTQSLNKSQQQLSVTKLSQTMTQFNKSQQFQKEIRTKLGYEWKNIYRSLLSQSDQVSLAIFIKTIHQHRVFLSKEELKKIESVYGGTQKGMIDFIKMGQDLGLNKESFDYMKTKNKDYIENLSQILGSSKSQVNNTINNY